MKFANTMTSILLLSLFGCSNIEQRVNMLNERVEKDVKKHQERLDESIPVVATFKSAWLTGTALEITEPLPAILTQPFAYHPVGSVFLPDVVSYINQQTGLIVDIAELRQTSSTASNTASDSGAYNITTPMTFRYEGTLSGFLDTISAKTGAWWKNNGGKVYYYRTETKTFYVPTLSRKFEGSNSIISTTGSGGTSGSSGTSTSVSTASGGSTYQSTYAIDSWTDFENTAKTVAAGATIAINRSTGSITVTGTPAQVRYVEEWVKSLTNELYKQVGLEVRIYSVKLSHEDNYNWNPNMIFKSASGVLGYSFRGAQVPAIVSGQTPFKFAVTANNNTSSGTNSQYNGSSLAFQALSSLGHVVEQFRQNYVTMNGQPLPIQNANQQGYQVSSSQTLTPNVGSTNSSVVGTLTTGFTALLIPRIINGKVVVSMSMENSIFNGFNTSVNGDQKPNTDIQKFQQIVSLTPGDAVMLTSFQRDKGNVSKNGVGQPDNYILGGGVDNTLDRQVIAIVISATIL